QEWQIDNCFKEISPNVDTKEVMNWISYQRNRMKDYKSKKFDFKSTSYTDEQLRKYFKAYEDLKNKLNKYDFDDYLLLCLDLLQKNPNKYTYEYILVDEHQDSNKVQNKLLEKWCSSGNMFVVGDYRQCFPTRTKIKTSEGYKNIEELVLGEEIVSESGRGKTQVTNVSEIMKKKYEGKLVTLKTKNGKNIKATPEHTIFLNTYINKEIHFVYLMYREDMGFRIGRAKQDLNRKKDKHRNGFETRTIGERADKSWVIKVCDTVEDAAFYELYYATEYGLPTYIFREGGRNTLLKQENIEELYKLLDNYDKGIKLLDSLLLSFDIPHYMPNGDSRLKGRYRVNFTMFATSELAKGKYTKFLGHKHGLSVSTTDEKFKKILHDNWEGNIQN